MNWFISQALNAAIICLSDKNRRKLLMGNHSTLQLCLSSVIIHGLHWSSQLTSYSNLLPLIHFWQHDLSSLKYNTDLALSHNIPLFSNTIYQHKEVLIQNQYLVHRKITKVKMTCGRLTGKKVSWVTKELWAEVYWVGLVKKAVQVVWFDILSHDMIIFGYDT